MPIYVVECPDCGHRFESLVLAGTKPPDVWHCSSCGGIRALPRPDTEPRPHPMEIDPDGRRSIACACG
jgi:hypothetical protein